MSKKVIFAILLILVIAGGGGYFFFVRKNAVEVKTVTVERKDLTKSASASGEISASQETTIYAPLTGTINEIRVSEGQIVSQNQALAVYDRMPFVQAQNQAYAAYLTAKLAKEQLDEATPSDLAKDKAQADVDAALTAFKQAESNLAKTEIKAPYEGTVLFNTPKIGNGATLAAGQPLFTVANKDAFIFEAEVDEADILKISLNQEAKVSIEALENKDFTGKVSFIAPSSIKTVEGETVYKVKIDIEKTNTELKLGLTGDANFILSKKENVLIVPFEAVLQEKEKSFVFVETNGKLTKRDVTLGEEVDGEWEVASGLHENETVVVENVERIKEGQRIKISN